MGAISTTILVVVIIIIAWMITFTTLGLVMKNPLYEKLGMIGPVGYDIHKIVNPRRESQSQSRNVYVTPIVSQPSTSPIMESPAQQQQQPPFTEDSEFGEDI